MSKKTREREEDGEEEMRMIREKRVREGMKPGRDGRSGGKKRGGGGKMRKRGKREEKGESREGRGGGGVLHML